MTATMASLVCLEPGRLALQTRPRPAFSGPGDVRLAVEKVGICGTDYHILAGRQPFLSYPRVMGHEIAARVTDGQGHVADGTLVVVNPYLSCGTCHACKRGKPNCCMQIRVLGVHTDGAMCEEIVVPAGNLYPAEGLTAEQAASVEFLAIGAHAVARAAQTGDDKALVIGAGPIGLATALFARIAGQDVTLMDVSRERLDMAADRFGFAQSLVAGDHAAEAIRSSTGGAGFDTVYDATGSAASMEAAIHHVAHGGKLVYVGLVKEALKLPDSECHKREMTIVRSRNALAGDFRHVMDSIRSGAIDVGRLVTHRTELSAMTEAMPVLAADRSTLIKAMISVGKS